MATDLQEHASLTAEDQLRTKRKSCPQMALFLAIKGDKKDRHHKCVHNFHTIQLDDDSEENTEDLPSSKKTSTQEEVDNDIGKWMIQAMQGENKPPPKKLEEPTENSNKDDKYHEFISALQSMMGSPKEDKPNLSQDHQKHDDDDEHQHYNDGDDELLSDEDGRRRTERPTTTSTTTSTTSAPSTTTTRRSRPRPTTTTTTTTTTAAPTTNTTTESPPCDDEDDEDGDDEDEDDEECDDEDYDHPYRPIKNFNVIINHNKDLGNIINDRMTHVQIQDQLKKFLGITCECKEREVADDDCSETGEILLEPKKPRKHTECSCAHQCDEEDRRHHQTPPRRRPSSRRRNRYRYEDDDSKDGSRKLRRQNRRTNFGPPWQRHELINPDAIRMFRNRKEYSTAQDEPEPQQERYHEQFYPKKDARFDTEHVLRSAKPNKSATRRLRPISEEWPQHEEESERSPPITHMEIRKRGRTSRRRKPSVATTTTSTSTSTTTTISPDIRWEEAETKMKLAQELAAKFTAARKVLSRKRNKKRGGGHKYSAAKKSTRKEPPCMCGVEHKDEAFLDELVDDLAEEFGYPKKTKSNGRTKNKKDSDTTTKKKQLRPSTATKSDDHDDDTNDGGEDAVEDAAEQLSKEPKRKLNPLGFRLMSRKFDQETKAKNMRPLKRQYYKKKNVEHERDEEEIRSDESDIKEPPKQNDGDGDDEDDDVDGDEQDEDQVEDEEEKVTIDRKHKSKKPSKSRKKSSKDDEDHTETESSSSHRRQPSKSDSHPPCDEQDEVEHIESRSSNPWNRRRQELITRAKVTAASTVRGPKELHILINDPSSIGKHHQSDDEGFGDEEEQSEPEEATTLTDDELKYFRDHRHYHGEASRTGTSAKRRNGNRRNGRQRGAADGNDDTVVSRRRYTNRHEPIVHRGERGLLDDDDAKLQAGPSRLGIDLRTPLSGSLATSGAVTTLPPAAVQMNPNHRVDDNPYRMYPSHQSHNHPDDEELERIRQYLELQQQHTGDGKSVPSSPTNDIQFHRNQFAQGPHMIFPNLINDSKEHAATVIPVTVAPSPKASVSKTNSMPKPSQSSKEITSKTKKKNISNMQTKETKSESKKETGDVKAPTKVLSNGSTPPLTQSVNSYQAAQFLNLFNNYKRKINDSSFVPQEHPVMPTKDMPQMAPPDAFMGYDGLEDIDAYNHFAAGGHFV